jgi:hypothetical protein
MLPVVALTYRAPRFPAQAKDPGGASASSCASAADPSGRPAGSRRRADRLGQVSSSLANDGSSVALGRCSRDSFWTG